MSYISYDHTTHSGSWLTYYSHSLSLLFISVSNSHSTSYSICKLHDVVISCGDVGEQEAEIAPNYSGCMPKFQIMCNTENSVSSEQHIP